MMLWHHMETGVCKHEKRRHIETVFANNSNLWLTVFFKQNLQIAEELLNRGVSVSALDKYGCHAVHYAALRNNAVLIKFFLGGFSINHCN